MMALRVSSTEPAIGELITNTAFLYSAGALSKMENSLKAALLALQSGALRRGFHAQRDNEKSA